MAQTQAPRSIHEIELPLLDGKPARLSDYAGKVVLVVNVASRCGFTPQYGGLQAIHDRYAERGFTVLCFPCNQFFNQGLNIFAAHAFEVPASLPAGSLHDLLTIFLDPAHGMGGILHVVNDTGGSSTIANPDTPVTVVSYP